MTDSEGLEKFIVRFFNPETNMLVTSVEAHVKDAASAVESGVKIASDMFPHLADEWRRYTASVTDATGAGISGLEKQLNKRQLTAQVEALMKQINALNDDGETPAQSSAVSQTLNAPRHVDAPPAANPANVVPNQFTPAPAAPQSMVVDPRDAPMGTNAPQFTKADIDAAVAEAQRTPGTQS